VSDTLARSASRTTEPRPQRTTRVKAQLTLRRQLRMSRTRRSLSFRSGLERRTFLVVPPIEGPSCDAPPPRRSQPWTGSANHPLTSPVAAPARGRNPFLVQPEPLPPPPRQRQRLSRLRMPSTDECSLGPAFAAPRARARHPDSRTLPSRPGFRRFFAFRKRKARHRRFRELIARERSAPRAARRLLQSKPFASTTTDRRSSRLW
jgi:hypothetical protein